MAKFIELHFEKGICLINVDDISYIQPLSANKSYTDIFLKSSPDSHWRIKKSYDEVKTLISEATK